jgi:hypothetical protein
VGGTVATPALWTAAARRPPTANDRLRSQAGETRRTRGPRGKGERGDVVQWKRGGAEQGGRHGRGLRRAPTAPRGGYSHSGPHLGETGVPEACYVEARLTRKLAELRAKAKRRGRARWLRQWRAAAQWRGAWQRSKMKGARGERERSRGLRRGRERPWTRFRPSAGAPTGRPATAHGRRCGVSTRRGARTGWARRAGAGGERRAPGPLDHGHERELGRAGLRLQAESEASTHEGETS